MPLQEKEQMCLEYINGKLEDPITEEHLKRFQVAFRSWKFCMDIYDTDLYHRIAQAMKVRELGGGFDGIYYRLNVPTAGGIPDHWTVGLGGARDSEFLEKYGQHYEVVY
jgi:hypothetical protein